MSGKGKNPLYNKKHGGFLFFFAGRKMLLNCSNKKSSTATEKARQPYVFLIQ